MLAVVVAEAAAIAVLGLLVTGLLRSHAEILRRLHDLGAGLDTDAPSHAHDLPHPARPMDGAVGASGDGTSYDITGTRVDGAAVAIAVRETAHDTVLAFLSTGCTTCRPFWDAFRADVALPENARLLVVVEDEDDPNRLRKLAAPGISVVRSTRAWEEYGVPGSPHFVYVEAGTGRVVGEGTGQTWDQVLDLIARGNSGRLTQAAEMPDGRDNPERIDRELAAAGIGPGHPSLYTALDDEA